MLKKFISRLTFNKYSVIFSLNRSSTVLDVGCGNHSPSLVKSILPNCIYTGVDIDYYNLDENDKMLADHLFIFPKERFFDNLEILDSKFDLILATHIIEHLEDPSLLFQACSKLLKIDGVLLISTPSIRSINFPSSKGTLNYYDDKTHIEMPILFSQVYDFCKMNNLLIVKYKLGRPSIVSKLVGFPFELIRKVLKRNVFTTWSYWGFEDIYLIKLNKNKFKS